MKYLVRRKSIDTLSEGHARLKPTLSWPHLVALGVGAIVGTGIYTLTGIGAGLAGPAVILSFALCGAICATAALCYAELSTMMPVAGSAYTYSYAVLGELFAWIIGWSLILEYTVGAAAVAVGWSFHFREFLSAAGLTLPDALQHGALACSHGFPLPAVFSHTFACAAIDLPAVAISAVVVVLLIIGTRESATVNIVLVLIKMAALVLFVALAAPAFAPAHFHPFAPFGYGAAPDADGMKRGVLAAAGLIFFAFWGFDAVSTAAEETKNPARDMTIGIIGSMIACTIIYIAVAAAALGAASYSDIARTGAPLVHVLQLLHHPLAGQIVVWAAVLALPSVILVLLYGQSRVWFVMARDGLFPPSLATVHKTRGTPVTMTLLAGFVVMMMSATLPLQNIAELANAGTLAAFIAVALSVIVLRVRDPKRPRIFRAPAAFVVAPLCIASCAYLFVTGLQTITQSWFFIWGGIGLVVYFLYGVRKSRLAQAAA